MVKCVLCEGSLTRPELGELEGTESIEAMDAFLSKRYHHWKYDTLAEA